MADPIEEQRLRTIQREYLDFLDDGVSENLLTMLLSLQKTYRKMKVSIKIN